MWVVHGRFGAHLRSSIPVPDDHFSLPARVCANPAPGRYLGRKATASDERCAAMTAKMIRSGDYTVFITGGPVWYVTGQRNVAGRNSRGWSVTAHGGGGA